LEGKSITAEIPAQMAHIKVGAVVKLVDKSGIEPSAKQNNAFCFFFWKKKNTI
jgi:hypothetical protein